LEFRHETFAGWFFGLVAGIVELAADAWLVDGTRTLDYSVGGGPMIWRCRSGCRWPGKW